MINHNELNYERGYQAGSKIMSDKLSDIKKILEYYLDSNVENGVIYIPRFVIEKIIKMN